MARLASVYFQVDRRPLQNVYVKLERNGVDVFQKDPEGQSMTLSDHFVPYGGLSHINYHDGE